MATMNVSLPDPMKDWIESQAASGRYSNTSDYVRDLIRREQDRLAKIENMQRLVSEGLESGISALSMTEILDTRRALHPSELPKEIIAQMEEEGYQGEDTPEPDDPSAS